MVVVLEPAAVLDLGRVPARLELPQGADNAENRVDGVRPFAHFADVARCARGADLKP
jgi:hypothetical protein